MGSTSERSKTTPAPKKRIPRWLVYLAAIIVAGCLAAGCIGTISIALFFSAMTATMTQADFMTDAQRIQHLNSVLPITIPTNATAVKYTQQGLQDRHIDAEFIIPVNEIDLFQKGLPPLDVTAPDHYEGKVGFTHLTIEFDRSTGRVHLVWFET